MRRGNTVPTALLVVLVLGPLGCGGEASGPPQPPPPPPPPPPAPATVVIQAGDQQTGEPGKPLPVRPAVTVRDAQGRGVPNVAVSFAVDSGGGTIAGASPNTGSDGIATAGEWTLGPADGRHLLRATVSGLAPVSFLATGRFTAITIVDSVAISPTSGSIRQDQPGSPLRGLKLTVPSGSYPQATRWSIRVEPSISISLPAGALVVGQVVLIGNDAEYADSLMVLELPVVDAERQQLVPFFYLKETGYLEAAPMIERTDSTIVIVSRHFSSDMLDPIGRDTLEPAVRRASAAQPIKLFRLVTIQVPNLAAPVQSGFLPGVDDWEFNYFQTYGAPSGTNHGVVFAEQFYYMALKAKMGKPLYQSYDRVAGLLEDNPRGFRLATMIARDNSWVAVARQITYSMAYHAASRGQSQQFDRLNWQALLANLHLRRGPQLVMAHDGTLGTMLLAYGADYTTVHVADPSDPERAHSLRFEPLGSPPLGNSWALYQFTPINSTQSLLLNRISWLGLTALMPAPRQAAFCRQFSLGTIGNSVFPKYDLEYFDYLLGNWQPLGDRLIVTEPHVSLRAVCPACPKRRPAGTTTGLRQMITVFDDKGVRLGDDRPDGQNGVTIPLDFGTHPLGLLGSALQASAVQGGLEFLPVDFSWHDVLRLPLRIESDPNPAEVGQDGNVILRHDGTLPAGLDFSWDFGDGTTPNPATRDSVVLHKYRSEGTFDVTVTLTDRLTGKRLGRVQGTVKAIDRTADIGIWRITSLSGGGSLGPPPEPLQPGTLLDEIWQSYVADTTDMRLVKDEAEAGYLIFISRDTLVDVGGVTQRFGRGIYLTFGDVDETLEFVRPEPHVNLAVENDTPASNWDLGIDFTVTAAGLPGNGTASGRWIERFKSCVGCPFSRVFQWRSVSLSVLNPDASGEIGFFYRWTDGPTFQTETEKYRWDAKYTFTAVRVR